MKVEHNKNKIVVYLFDDKYTDADIKNMLISVFNDLNKYYDIDFKSSYVLKLYINRYYGVILELEESNSKPNDNIVNLKLNILYDSLFLYEINEPLNYLNYEMYYYKDKFFINVNENNINIFEDSNIIYGNDVYKILGKGIKI